MKLNKFILMLGGIAHLLLLLGGCSDDGVCKVYIPEARSVVIKNFDLGSVLEETFHVAVTSSDYVTVSGKEVSGDVTVRLVVDEAKVHEYNAACGTDYPILPADCYTLPTEAVISAGTAASEAIILSVHAQGKIQPFDSYLLPITIASVEGARADVIQQTLYYLVSGAEDVWAMPLADRSQWKILEFSSEEAAGEGPDNGHAIHAFDGLKETFWHTQWQNGEPQPPHHIVVDMGKEVKMLGFQYISRDFGTAWPQEITMETSLDGKKWESAGIYSDLPAGAKEEFRSYFPGFKQARYFRLTVTAVYDGKWATAIAEINAISISK